MLLDELISNDDNDSFWTLSELIPALSQLNVNTNQLINSNSKYEIFPSSYCCSCWMFIEIGQICLHFLHCTTPSSTIVLCQGWLIEATAWWFDRLGVLSANVAVVTYGVVTEQLCRTLPCRYVNIVLFAHFAIAQKMSVLGCDFRK